MAHQPKSAEEFISTVARGTEALENFEFACYDPRLDIQAGLLQERFPNIRSMSLYSSSDEEKRIQVFGANIPSLSFQLYIGNYFPHLRQLFVMKMDLSDCSDLTVSKKVAEKLETLCVSYPVALFVKLKLWRSTAVKSSVLNYLRWMRM